jgi:exonuclease SbcC
MIKVRVQNFQSIEDAELVIDGLTVLTGTNNAGKSAFFRAIRGAFTNARGYDFVRYGKPHCQVDITFDDNRTLTWKKGKGVNTYVVNGKEYPKVSHGVPPEAQIFGIESVTAGKTDLWPQIAPQITGVSFLLHETGSVIAEAVADVTRVNQLSRALKACESDRRSAKGDLKIRRGDATTLAERRETFSGLDEAVAKIPELEKGRKTAEKITKALVNVEKLQRRHRDAVAAVTALEGLDDARESLPDMVRVDAAREASGELSTAEELRGRWAAAGAEVGALEGLESVEETLPNDDRMEYAQQFRKGVGVTVELAVRYEEARKDLDTAEQAQGTLAEIDLDDGAILLAAKFKKALGNATKLKDRYIKNRDAVTDLDREIRDQQKLLDELTTQAASVLGTYQECPTCGGGLDHVH